ncbi:MAG: hypothetical protein RLZZ502_170, partial [Pseudomonadota bacterium]
MKLTTYATPVAEKNAVVDHCLDAYNQEHGAQEDVFPLSVIAESQQGQIVGGAIGRTWGQCAELQELAVMPDQRQQGVGTALMQQFELAARARGCTTVYLTTFSFQAPEFYQRLGFAIAHQIDGFTKGNSKYT